MKRHWVRLPLRSEAPKDVKIGYAIASGGLKWQYIAIIATFLVLAMRGIAIQGTALN